MTNAITDPLVGGQEEGLDTAQVQFDLTPEGVATVLICRPASGNRLNWSVLEALNQVFETLHGADGVRVIFLRGSGETFCQGSDPDWRFAETGGQAIEKLTVVEEVEALLHRLWAAPALTVALLQGQANGAGAWLAAACDIVVALDTTTICFTDEKLAAGKGVVSPYLRSAVGDAEADRLIASGDALGTGEVLRLGVVQELVADNVGFSQVAERIAQSAVSGEIDQQLSPAIIRRIKEKRPVWGDR